MALGDELGDGSLLAQRRGGAGYSPGPLCFLGQRCVTIVSVRSRVRPLLPEPTSQASKYLIGLEQTL